MKKSFFVSAFIFISLSFFSYQNSFAINKTNIIRDQNFSSPIDDKNWKIGRRAGADGKYSAKNGIFEMTSLNPDVSEEYNLQLFQENINLVEGGIYKLSFEAEAIKEEQFYVKLGGNKDSNGKTFLYKKLSITPKFQRYEYLFSVDNKESNARLEFWFTKVKSLGRIKNISLLLIDTKSSASKKTIESRATEDFKNLVWVAEFNNEGAPNKEKFTYEIGGGGWGNKELQYYTTDLKNSYVKDGKLHIVAIKEPYKGNSFTSARLTTKGKATIKYGKIDIYAKLPTGKGTWSAFWLYGRGKKYSEIDIMEHVGAETGIIHFSTHSTLHLWDTERHRTSSITVEEIGTKFHLYSIEWTPEYIKGFVDNIEYFNVFKKDIDPNLWEFDEQMFLVFNLAVGGTWGGMSGVNDKSFPQEIVIDYVKVYDYKKN
ncbi:MAG: glycoside hydrolase family 16 protein [Fusobacteriaceae bacterium]